MEAAPSSAATFESERAAVEKLHGAREIILRELRKKIVGQESVVEELLIALLSGGHCLITGAPGRARRWRRR